MRWCFREWAFFSSEVRRMLKSWIGVLWDATSFAPFDLLNPLYPPEWGTLSSLRSSLLKQSRAWKSISAQTRLLSPQRAGFHGCDAIICKSAALVLFILGLIHVEGAAIQRPRLALTRYLSAWCYRFSWVFRHPDIDVFVPNPVWYYGERQHAEILTLK